MGSRVQGSHRDTSHSTAMASETTDIRVQSQHLVLSTGVAGFPAEQDQSLGSQGLGVEGFPMPKLGKQRGLRLGGTVKDEASSFGACCVQPLGIRWLAVHYHFPKSCTLTCSDCYPLRRLRVHCRDDARSDDGLGRAAFYGKLAEV